MNQFFFSKILIIYNGTACSIEGLHLDGDDPHSDIDRLWDAGVRLFGITHFFDTPLAGSAHGASRSGLTTLGKSVLRHAATKSVFFDVAHASPATIDDLVQLNLER